MSTDVYRRKWKFCIQNKRIENNLNYIQKAVLDISVKYHVYINLYYLS